MAIAAKSAIKFDADQFTGAVRESAQRVIESAQAKLEKVQVEGRSVLSRQILKSAERAGDLSKALTELSRKVAPATKAKPKAKAKPAVKKVVAKATAKPRARRATAAA